ncbi:hypothetical protein K505DRAFT_342478 [Melanomma pulvis-pyrius CBS 109.77]|uniref:Uncharacterized protein n=1 Tax=Melanomma pulvis-pyrius CBS 109.77 TaxID=1314802 RepID=A0A6A6WUU6_9PLEO|nr:hypothetical protein K505DRAFT_342478 [Melanomma pulvis-pyrius CBS 109.77]
MAPKETLPTPTISSDRCVDDLVEQMLETKVKQDDPAMDAAMSDLADALEKKWSPGRREPSTEQVWTSSTPRPKHSPKSPPNHFVPLSSKDTPPPKKKTPKGRWMWVEDGEDENIYGYQFFNASWSSYFTQTKYRIDIRVVGPQQALDKHVPPMSQEQDQDHDLSHNYQWIDSKRIPKWTTTSSPHDVPASQPAKTDEATPSAPSSSQSTPQRMPTPRGPDSDGGWSLLTSSASASGAEENGTASTCDVQQGTARQERQRTSSTEQKARRKEQREINERTARELKGLEARQREMRRLSGRGRAGGKVDSGEEGGDEQGGRKRGRFGWLGRLMGEV